MTIERAPGRIYVRSSPLQEGGKEMADTHEPVDVGPTSDASEPQAASTESTPLVEDIDPANAEAQIPGSDVVV